MKVNTTTTVEITNKEQELVCDILDLCDFDYDEDISTFMRDIYNCKETTKLPNTKKIISIKYTEEKTLTEEVIIAGWKVRDLLSDLNDAMSCGKCPLNNSEICDGYGANYCINLFLDYARKYDFEYEE